MAGYTRQSANEIVDNAIIDAADFNNEFNQILSAFNASTGHAHDGTASEGPRIEVFGQAGELVGSTANVLKPNANNTVDLGTSTVQFKDLYIDGKAYLDAIDLNGTDITSTAAEINIVDGSTAATSTTLADADRLIVNDNGTMVQVALTDFEVYFESALDTLSNVTTVGALNAGSITSGFGTIDTGSSNISTTGTVTYGTLNDGTTALTSTVAELNVLDGITATVSELNALDGITSTVTELNIVDGSTSATATTVADADRVVLNDNGTMVQAAVTDLDTYFSGTTKTLTNKTLTTPTIAQINNASGSITLDASTDIILDADGADIVLKDAGTQYGAFTNTSGNLIIKSGSTTAATFSGANVDLAGTLDVTGNATFDGNATITGNLTVNGTTTTIATSNTVVSDSLMELANGTTGTPANDSGIVIERGSANNAFIGFDESVDKFTVGTGTFTGASTGNLSITTGTLVANIEGDVTGDVTGNADTATALATSRNFSVTGDVTASAVGFDGSGNVALATTLAAGVVDTAELAADAVTNAKIADDAVTEDNILLGGSGHWDFAVGADNNLDFRFNGTVVFSISSAGAIVAKNNVTAFGTP